MATRFIADLKVIGEPKNVIRLITNELEGRVVVKDKYTFNLVSDSRFIGVKRLGDGFVDTNVLTFDYPKGGKEMVTYIPLQMKEGFSDLKQYQILSIIYDVELIGKSFNNYAGLINNMHVKQGSIVDREIRGFNPYDYMYNDNDYLWDVMIEGGEVRPYADSDLVEEDFTWTVGLE